MSTKESASAQLKTLRSSAHHNPQWLVEDLLPLGSVEVGWCDDLIDFNYELAARRFRQKRLPRQKPTSSRTT